VAAQPGERPAGLSGIDDRRAAGRAVHSTYT